ncbi:hypothetical protein ACJDU8_16430 [Clostridium sp. WILCCON 0269]|uniref:Uncharacterized protein n=1 Tax=Candidatus Clostridium eludens TaxID=3381663 RepID=A0ABW8SP48_9CLOT
MENDKIFELMTKMYTEMKEGFNKIDELEEKVNKNTLMLEKQGKDIQLLAEGHKNLSEQMDRKFEELNKTIDRNYSLHDRAIKEISKTSSKGEKAYDFIKELSDKNFGN